MMMVVIRHEHEVFLTWLDVSKFVWNFKCMFNMQFWGDWHAKMTHTHCALHWEQEGSPVLKL